VAGPISAGGLSPPRSETGQAVTKLINSTGTAFTRTSTAVFQAAQNYVDADEKAKQRNLSVVKDIPKLELPL